MLRFHHFLKESSEFQRLCHKDVWQFPPGSAWIVFTDTASHACLSGQYALEQTLIIRHESLSCPEKAPISILEELAGFPLKGHGHRPRGLEPCSGPLVLWSCSKPVMLMHNHEHPRNLQIFHQPAKISLRGSGGRHCPFDSRNPVAARSRRDAAEESEREAQPRGCRSRRSGTLRPARGLDAKRRPDGVCRRDLRRRLGPPRSGCRQVSVP